MKHLKLILIAILLLCMVPIEQAWGQSRSQVRCEALTKKGTRCKNKSLERSKYCRVHQAKDANVAQCKAKTKSGTRCSKAAKTMGFCTQHYKMKLEGKIN